TGVATSRCSSFSAGRASDRASRRCSTPRACFTARTSPSKRWRRSRRKLTPEGWPVKSHRVSDRRRSRHSRRQTGPRGWGSRGRVAGVAPFTSSEASARRSEHDPELWRADVEVIAVLKGQRPGSGRVQVYFAHSTDERWILSPKYTAGQEGIFLLHTEE